MNTIQNDEWVQQVDQWLTVPSETQQLEFKEAKNQFDNTKLCQYCVALANEGGGHLVLGVTDRQPRKVVGTQAFNDPIKMESKLFETLGFRVDIREVSHPNGRVLVFDIPARPKGVPLEYDGGYWMRAGENLVKMSQDRLRSIFAESQPGWLELTAKENVTAQEVVDLLDTHAYFKRMNERYPTSQAEVISNLLNRQLISKAGNGYNILNIGALLFANDLEQFLDSSVYHKAVRVIRYDDNSKLDSISDFTWGKGYAAGFDNLVTRIIDHLPQKEEIQIYRRSIILVDKIVIRELLANAMVHQDLTESGRTLRVEIYSDRVKISNPGEPLIDLDRLIDDDRPRNKTLIDLMRRLNLCEQRGSGIDKVIQSVEQRQQPPPEFRAELGKTTVTVFGDRAFHDMSQVDKIRACFQHCVLQYIQDDPMNNQSLRERFGLTGNGSDTSKVSQIISATIKQKLIKTDPTSPGARKYARYLPFWA